MFAKNGFWRFWINESRWDKGVHFPHRDIHIHASNSFCLMCLWGAALPYIPAKVHFFFSHFPLISYPILSITWKCWPLDSPASTHHIPSSLLETLAISQWVRFLDLPSWKWSLPLSSWMQFGLCLFCGTAYILPWIMSRVPIISSLLGCKLVEGSNYVFK